MAAGTRLIWTLPCAGDGVAPLQQHLLALQAALQLQHVEEH